MAHEQTQSISSQSEKMPQEVNYTVSNHTLSLSGCLLCILFPEFYVAFHYPGPGVLQVVQL